jgi:RND family efflux transporter MFP subunit
MIRTRILTNLMLAILAAIVATGCGSRRERDTGETSAPARAVQVYRVEPEGNGVFLTLPARVTAREEVTVRATVAGRVTDLPYAEGEPFKAGTILSRFDAPETRAAVAAARAEAAAAALRLDLARKQEARLDSLFAQRVAALRELELARSDLRAAEAAEADARAAEAALRAGVEIPAPFAGVVVRRHVDPGATVAAGQPLLDIRSQSAGEIVAAIPEGAVSWLGVARVAFQTGDGRWHPAVLARVDGMTDFTTRTRNARFRPLSRGGRLDPGAFARIRIEPPAVARSRTRPGGKTESASQPLTIPSRCLVRRGGLSGVFVVRDGRATLRWLRVGRTDSLATDVLAGISPGEALVLDPGDLADGQAVTER